MAAFYDKNGNWNTSCSADRNGSGWGETVAEMLNRKAQEAQQAQSDTARIGQIYTWPKK